MVIISKSVNKDFLMTLNILFFLLKKMAQQLYIKWVNSFYF